MSKFKICPDCGRRNPPGRIECEGCEADLTAVPLTDGEAKKIPRIAPLCSLTACEAAPGENMRLRG